MSTSQQDSSLSVDPGKGPARVAPSSNGGPPRDNAKDRKGTIWLSGDVLLCACPDCQSPMAIRAWLMTADCWKCGTSVDLSIEQEQEVERLLALQEKATAEPPKPSGPPEPNRKPAAATTAPPALPIPKPQPARQSPPPEPKARPQEKPEAEPLAPKRDPRQRATPPPAPNTGPAVPPPPPYDQTGSLQAAQLRSSNLWQDLLAWLISLVFHLLLMIILGLWTFSDEEFQPKLVLSVSVGQHREGGEPAEEDHNETEFELPVEKKPENEKEKAALVQASQEAKELRMDPNQETPNLPDLVRVKADLVSDDPYRRMHAARDPRVRAEIVRREGGTTLTEAAVARALRWISKQQNPDGSWSLHTFPGAPDAASRADGRGGVRTETGGTALALMAMLGTGQTHRVGIYRKHVSRGLRWLLDQQKADGDLRAGAMGNTGMYAHGQATIVLCDAFKITGDETLRAPAQKALDFICAAQHPAGGWRYLPGQPGDLSVVGWQLMAAHSAKSAYLHVPKENMSRAGSFLNSVQSGKHGGLYAYLPRSGPTPTMTAEGLLSRMYLGWQKTEPGLKEGVDFLVAKHLPDARRPNIYYWYYGTQVMHHWGGQEWKDWNLAIRKALVTTQVSSGPHSGSWSPKKHPHGAAGGRLYVTALSACTLEVYYRYAPIYWKMKLK